MHFLGVIFSTRGRLRGTGPPTVFLGPPHISEISRDRKLKFYKHLGRVKYFFRVRHFLRHGACKGRSTPNVHLGTPLISETIRTRKLKFYKNLGRVKYSSGTNIFPLGGVQGVQHPTVPNVQYGVLCPLQSIYSRLLISEHFL